MLKEKNDLLIIIMFSILLAVSPISYDEMRAQHPISSKESIILVKNTNSNSSSDDSITPVLEDQDDLILEDQENLTTNQVGDSSSDSTKKFVTIKTSHGKELKIDIVFHRRLEKSFPDWEERITYQQDREKVYQAAMLRRKEVIRLQKEENFGRTKDEQDAIDYFSGSGFYQSYQDPSVKYNIFDNRQSFLIKMHDREMRMNFLKNFNRVYDSNS